MSADDPMPDDDLIAAELAFGLLDGADRRAAEARLGEPDFAAAYARWQAYAVAMLAGRDEAPPSSVWAAIQARLPANDDVRALRTSVRGWRYATFATGLAAVLLGVIAVERSAPPTVAPTPAPQIAQAAPQAPLVAVLTGANKDVVTVSYDPASGRITSASTGIDTGRRATELWVIPAVAGAAPRSLGVIAAAGAGWRQVPAARIPDLAPGVTLAISLEPIGGSKTGLPTGPVILTGKVVAT